MNDSFRWRKMKNRDMIFAEKLLRDMEDNCVGACGRFITRQPLKDPLWALRGANNKLLGLLLNSRSALMPVLCGLKEIPKPDFLRGFFRIKKIHCVQGLKDEVIIFENEIERMGRESADIIDYDLMTLDNLPLKKGNMCPENLVLRVPQMTDLDAIAPLQAAYELEEVLPKGSVFSPAASRVNISNIIAQGQILAAEIDGRIVGKINVSAVSFTRFQVGGVYVHPDFRGLGIARRMTADFIGSLLNRGMGVTLFVKKTNLPARRLYTGLGFSIRGNYRITYY